MKKTFLFSSLLALACFFCVSASAQYYPGGFAQSKINLWYDASDSTTLTIQTNGNISAWKDKSNNLSAIQNTDASRPILTTLNGNKMVTFNGRKGLSIAYNPLLVPSTGYDLAQIVYVYPDASPTVNSYIDGTFSGDNAAQGSPYMNVRWVDSNSSANNQKYELGINRNNTGYYLTPYNDLRGNSFLGENYTSRTNGTTYAYYNGVGALADTGITYTNASVGATIGNAATFDSVHWGVSETVLAGFDTKASGRTIIEYYLAAKWGMLDTLQTYQGNTYFQPTNTTFIHDLVGIGTQGGSDSISYTGSNDGLGLQNVNGTTGFLRATGSYIMAADNGQGGTVALGTSFTRWSRSWFIDKTDPSGYGGLLNVYFDFANYGITSSLDTVHNAYYLLYNPTCGYFTSGTNYLIPVSSTRIFAGTNQLAFLLDAINLSNGFYTIIYAPKGTSTSTIPLLATFTPPSITVSPAPKITSVFAGNTYDYVFIDSSAITYPVSYYKIYVSINGGSNTLIDSTSYYTPTTTPSYSAHYHLTNGNTYTYTVTAVFAPGKESVVSNSVSAVPSVFTPTWGLSPQYQSSTSSYMSAGLPGYGLPLKFYFKDVTNGDTSGYQASSNYAESNLTSGNTYTYEFKIIDSTQGVSTASNWSTTYALSMVDSVQGGFTYNLNYLDPTTIWAPNGIGGPATITPATENMSLVRMVEHAPPVGVHPRVFCNPEDSTSIRWRLTNTYSGVAAAKWIHAYTTILNLGSGFNGNAYYNKDTMGNVIVSNTGKWNVQPYYNNLAAGDTSATYNFSNLWNGKASMMAYLFSQEAMECWLYRGQNDPATGINYTTRATKLAKAMTVWAKEALADTATPLNATNAAQYGSANMFYAYDFLYNQMTVGQQDTVRMALMAVLPDSTLLHGLETPSYTATSNWLSFPQGVTYFFAVEGEPGYNAEDTATVKHYMRTLWDFLTYGVYSTTGNVLEAIGKDQLDVPDLYAAAKRGYSMLGHPSVLSYGAKYLPAVVQPFGYSFVGTDLLGGTQSITGYTGASSPSTGGPASNVYVPVARPPPESVSVIVSVSA